MQQYNTRLVFAVLASMFVLILFITSQAEAGGKGNKGKGGEDIILYNGNIVMRGDKKGGNFVLANNHPVHEEVEFAPDYFKGDFGGHGGHGGHGGFWRR